MALCPACARPVAVARPRCLYCGALLSAEAVAEAEQSTRDVQSEKGPASEERLLVVLEHQKSDPQALARALGLTLFDASQRAARGGFELLRTAPRVEAWDVAFALEAAGFLVFLVRESEARRPPTPVRGGGFEDERLRLTTGDGETAIGRDDLLLVVRGPIAREYQTQSQDRTRFRSATLPAGYLVHLHLRQDVPPLEIDPDNFEFAVTSRQGSLLELGLWLDSLGAPTDDGFKKLAPALAPTVPGATGVAATARALVHAEGEGALVLDNVAQFRLYSGWRGAVERRRT
jgi:hypothetical protein